MQLCKSWWSLCRAHSTDLWARNSCIIIRESGAVNHADAGIYKDKDE